MKKKNITAVFVILFIFLLLAGIGFLLTSRYHVFKGHTLSTVKALYYCPMHPGYTSDRPGDCPICNMKLVKKEQVKAIEEKAKTPQDICVLHNCPMLGANCPMQISGDVKDCPFCGAHLAKGKKLLYYRHPMKPGVSSPVPMKDEMGMDYVPVYEEEAAGAEGISISSERQQLIGVKKERVQMRKLAHKILTVGRIAYDPMLFVAQVEYLQALKTKEKISESALPLIKEQSESLAEAAKRKLLLLGMNEQGIEELAKSGRPQENLYLPLKADTVWVYMTIYEYEMGLIKEGQPVEIEAVAFPAEVFKGKIMAITPVLDPMTRSVQVRAEIENPEQKLKPDMFVNVKIEVDLGEKVAVSEEAVMHTGKKTIVVVTDDGGRFFSREVKIGYKAEGFYEVLEGLQEGDIVVTSGNFLIDSESRLQSAVSSAPGAEGEEDKAAIPQHKHGQ